MIDQQFGGVHHRTRVSVQSSDLLAVHSHQRRSLSRAVRGQGIHTVTLDAKSNFASRVRSRDSHRSHSLAIAVRRQHVHIVTQRGAVLVSGIDV
jgi:hypothetical protein